MKAVISTTIDDQYLFYLPITVWSWNKLGIGIICFTPHPGLDFAGKITLVNKFIQNMDCEVLFYECPLDKKATYAQCSRLFAAAINDIPESEILITGDIDMAVFNSEYFSQANCNNIHVFGADLVPEKQFPMCYIAMPVKTWRDVMWISDYTGYQEKLDNLLGHIECDHFKGNMWCKDQESAYNHIVASGLTIAKHNRASPGTQFATRRADRDGWPENFAPDLIDAHLPRPGYTDENFTKILNLFQSMYPNENFNWMNEYRNEYIKLI